MYACVCGKGCNIYTHMCRLCLGVTCVDVRAIYLILYVFGDFDGCCL